MRYIYIVFVPGLLLLGVILSSCRKFVDAGGPPTSISSADVFNNDQTAAGSITYLYAQLSGQGLSTIGELSSLSCIAGLSADEFSYYSPAGDVSLEAFYKNTLTNQNIPSFIDYWTTSYRNLYAVNLALEGLSASSTLTPAVKQQLTGEARFMRAFYYFYLVNLYGDVPLVLNTDYTLNALITKTPKDLVYKQIIVDLKEAQMLLSPQYLKGDGITTYDSGVEERVRPTKWAATALLARTYLYIKDWSNAEIQASLVLANTAEFHLEPINNVFLKNSKEAIWQLQPITRGFNTKEGDFFIIPVSGLSSDHPVFLNNSLLTDFESTDQRRANWVGEIFLGGKTYCYPYKYKAVYSSETDFVLTEYSVVLRLAEQYLIRSEARAQLNKNNLAGAIADVDQIRGRAGLSLLKDVNPNISQENLITEILKQKRIELFTEWGHRWLDLKRTEKINEVMTYVTPLKAGGGRWMNHQQYYPISLDELKANPNLTPTPGY